MKKTCLAQIAIVIVELKNVAVILIELGNQIFDAKVADHRPCIVYVVRRGRSVREISTNT